KGRYPRYRSFDNEARGVTGDNSLFQETIMVHVLCRRSVVLLVALLSASLGTGCRRSDGMTFDVLDGVKYRILVQPGAPSFTSSKTTEESGQEIFRWDNGNLKIELTVTTENGCGQLQFEAKDRRE